MRAILLLNLQWTYPKYLDLNPISKHLHLNPLQQTTDHRQQTGEEKRLPENRELCLSSRREAEARWKATGLSSSYNLSSLGDSDNNNDNKKKSFKKKRGCCTKPQDRRRQGNFVIRMNAGTFFQGGDILRRVRTHTRAQNKRLWLKDYQSSAETGEGNGDS